VAGENAAALIRTNLLRTRKPAETKRPRLAVAGVALSGLRQRSARPGGVAARLVSNVAAAIRRRRRRRAIARRFIPQLLYRALHVRQMPELLV
jgi:hypothetical protein